MISSAANSGAEMTGNFRSALKDLGFFPTLFSIVFGTPAIVTLAQAVLVKRDLASPIQSMIHAYREGMALFGGWIEPRLQPIWNWIGRMFHMPLHLYPHWRHLLVILLAYPLAAVRADVKDGEVPGLYRFVLLSFVLIGVLVTGLVPLKASWYSQGLVAAIPICFLALGQQYYDLSVGVLIAAFLSILGFAVAAGLSLIPGLALASGLITVSAFIVINAINDLTYRRAEKHIGMSVLGGYVGAGLLFGADWLVRTYH